MSKTKLLPCPFCGETPAHDAADDAAWCSNRACKCSGTSFNTHAWDTRTPDPHIADLEARLKAAGVRLAQIASGDYKVCGHSAEEVAADALRACNLNQPFTFERVTEDFSKLNNPCEKSQEPWEG